MIENHPRPKLYIFCWPSTIGGADTKLVHLLLLLHRHCQITVIPNQEERMHEREWIRFMDRRGIRYTILSRLPKTLEGYAISFSNERFFVDRIAHRAKERGLKIIWSSEMMWHHSGELEAIQDGVIDHVLYVSEFQKAMLCCAYKKLPSTITGNYIDPNEFPFIERKNTTFTIGRLSRPAPEKYPEDFPVFYECLSLPDTHFRVMAWSQTLAHKYRWHQFDERRWQLLGANQETQRDFLHSLDLFVYPLGHTFQESWGRSTVEAMLTGCIPLVPKGHHFESLIVHGESGFLCGEFAEWQEHAMRLRMDYAYRQIIAINSRKHAEINLCDEDKHRKIWLDMFAEIGNQPPSATLTRV